MVDSLKSRAIRHGINLYLNGRYGEVQSLVIDTTEKRIHATLLLNGEPSPIDLTVGQYLIHPSKGPNLLITLHRIVVSRKWMQELASDNLENKTFPLPDQLTIAVKAIL